MNKTKSVKQSFDLTEKIVVITGGAGLLGEKHAEAIAEFGGIPILLDIDKKTGDEKAQRISKEYKVDCEFQYCDITHESQISGVRDFLLNKFGQIDILVNNAGTIGAPGWEERDVPDESDWDAIYAVNLKGMAKITEAVIPTMKSNRKGKIINMSSITGRLGTVTSPPYGVSKAGVINMTRYLASYFREKNIRVN